MPKYNQKTNNCKQDNAESLVRSSEDGSLDLRNPHLKRMSQDFLYHLGLNTYNLHEMFGDVKFICMGGTKPKMEYFANYIMTEIGHKIPTGTTLCDITQHYTRYSMYKVGPVLCVSNGMGMASLSIVLHEIIKLMYYAKVKDPIIFKVGTSGGLGVEKGTVVITENVVDAKMNSYYEVTLLGESVKRPAKLDINLVLELQDLAIDSADPYSTISGTTMCTTDFYEDRIDGAFCDLEEEEDLLKYLKKLCSQGIINIEMQGIAFAAITHHARIRAAMVCCTLTDRLEYDMISDSKVLIDEWQMRPYKLIYRYIKRCLQNDESFAAGRGSTDNRPVVKQESQIIFE